MCNKRRMDSAAFKMVAGCTPGIHVVSARSAHTFPKHSHDDFGIGVITFGAQRWQSGRKQVEAGTGCAIAVNAGEVHDGSAIGDNGRAWHMLYISPAVLQAAASDVLNARATQFEFVAPVIDDSRVAHLVRRLLTVESDVATDPMRSEELLLSLAARAGEWEPANDRPLPASVAAAKQRIDDDPTTTLSLGTLAHLGGIGRFQLLRSFVRMTGFTPHAYVVQRRIDLARRLISRGERLADVAAACGFADQSHMTRTFVSKYGIAPGAYARAVR